MDNKQFKIVYNVVDRGERSFWNRIGTASTNRDGSLTVRLDSFPLSGTMQVRDWTPKEDSTDNTTEPQSSQRGDKSHLPDHNPMPAGF